MATPKLPLHCFGTMEHPGKSASVLRDSVYSALQAGYRHLDTAEIYATTEHVGQAIEAAINDKVVARKDLFVTSKLKGMPVGGYSKVEGRVKQLLKSLKLKQVDLLLMHWPGPESIDLANQSPEDVGKAASFEWFKKNIQEAWANMVSLRQAGYAKHIGTSNFYQQHIEALCMEGVEKPFANQIFLDLCHQETDFVKRLQGLDIQIMAYRPLAFCGVYSMIEDVSKSLTELVESTENCSSVQQLVLSALVAKGICVVSSSTDNQHLKDNLRTVKVEPRLIEGYDGNEMVNMYGGVDEYAMAFKAQTK